VIDWTQPPQEFHRYPGGLINAGYSRRIMFGSDQMVWPEAIDMVVTAFESAEWPTPQQRSDILLARGPHPRHHGARIPGGVLRATL
jgi:predicted TIM-barrel fold metal-dependent hydrolase